MNIACALFWFGVAGFCLAMLGAGIGVTIAAFCWLGSAVAWVAGIFH
jgi:hypothetical protein